MTRLADDFGVIRARRDELARERDAALSAAPADDDVDLIRAIFGDPAKAAAHAEATGPAGECPAAANPEDKNAICTCRPAEAVSPPSEWLAVERYSNPELACALAIARHSGVELASGPRGWSGVVNGLGFGPRSLSRALATARVLREVGRR